MQRFRYDPVVIFLEVLSSASALLVCLSKFVGLKKFAVLLDCCSAGTCFVRMTWLWSLRGLCLICWEARFKIKTELRLSSFLTEVCWPGYRLLVWPCSLRCLVEVCATPSELVCLRNSLLFSYFTFRLGRYRACFICSQDSPKADKNSSLSYLMKFSFLKKNKETKVILYMGKKKKNTWTVFTEPSLSRI